MRPKGIAMYWLAGSVAVCAAMAQAEVVLTSKDGESSLRGDISAFENGIYTIETSIGAILVDAALVDCTGLECPDYQPLDQMVRIAGPEALMAGLVPPLIDAYASAAEARAVATGSASGGGQAVELTDGPDKLVTFETRPSATDAAFAALLAGEVEIVLSDRRVSDAEIDQFLDAGLGDLSSPQREAIVALDAVAPILSDNAPVSRLNFTQLASMFSGEITNWAAVGGPDAPINIYLPDDGGTVASSFERALLEPEFLSLSETATRLASSQAVLDAVSSDPNGLGLATTFDADLALSAECGLPVRQGAFAVKSEDYPLSRRIYMYTAAGAVPTRAAGLVETAQSVAASAGLEPLGYYGLDASSTGIGAHGDQLAHAITDPTQAGNLASLRSFTGEVLTADRLSVTFRFGQGSSQLDNRAAADAARLAVQLADEDLAGREILLIGFTDSIGRDDVNELLAVRRAQQVVDAIAAAAEDGIDFSAIRTLGYGSAFPVACNTTEAGRQMNRRVEVWVR